MRTGPASARRRACTTKAPTDARTPAAAARKSVRRLNRSMVAADIAAEDMAAADMAAEDMAKREMRSRTEPLAAVRPPGRHHLAAAFGRHPGAKAVAALAHQFARLVGPFHGIDLRRRPVSPQAKRREFDRRAIGAAYTKALPARQCKLPSLASAR